MRIAVVHSFYSRSAPSGENRVVEDQVRKLAEAGHDVHLVARETDDLLGAIYGVRTALGVATRTGVNPTSTLEEIAPDVVHIHNLFPNFGTRWVRHWHGPIVHSVHNYRAVCSNGLLYRDGNICQECPKSGSLHALQHRCYRDSLLATFPVWLSRAGYTRDVLKRANAVVTTSERSDKVLRASVGFPLETVVIPNFGPSDRAQQGEPDSARFWIAVGRMTEEKGFVELVRDWPSGERLVLVGDGPLFQEIREVARRSGKQVEIRSAMPIDELRRLIERAFALVFPSRWFEVDPQVIVEAMQRGLPIVAYSANAGAEIAQASRAGAVYSDKETLPIALRRIIDCRVQMSHAAMTLYDSRWAPRVWLRSMSALYEHVAALGGHEL